MIDSDFKIFAEKNLLSLDELLKIFAEFKIEACESFWHELSVIMKDAVPEGYSYISEGKQFEKAGGVSAERLCGWKKDISSSIDLLTERDIQIGFATYISPQQLAYGEWQIYRPWTGIKVWLDRKREKEATILTLLDRQRSLIKSEPDEQIWHLFRLFSPLDIKAVGLSGFYESLTGSKLIKNVEAIKVEMLEWVKLAEDILVQSH